MKYLFSKVFPLFFFPWPLLLMVLWFLSGKVLHLRVRKMLRVVIVFAAVISIPAVADLLLRVTESGREPVSLEKLRDGRRYAFIVLTGFADLNSRTTEVLPLNFGGAADRLLTGLELLQQTPGSLLILSGSQGTLLNRNQNQSVYSRSEAELVKSYLESSAVFPRALLTKIHIEARARNTRENAEYSEKILHELEKKNGVKYIPVVVTSAFHMRRSLLLFRARFPEVLEFPAEYLSREQYTFPEDFFPAAGGLDLFTLALREWIGTAAYGLLGYYRK